MFKTEIKSKTLTGLLVLLFGLAAITGCAGTGEGGGGDCDCAESDLQCKERCLQEAPI